ncbi:lipase 3-like [Lutzomyia longipalpis]|uniref:lipase 3-like n=1 Tax=Lutzomyia longipalpis TaxID=7200 RepID=UPI002483EFA2|nr:lipase 3-like [Lutzomyia longipalpis]
MGRFFFVIFTTFVIFADKTLLVIGEDVVDTVDAESLTDSLVDGQTGDLLHFPNVIEMIQENGYPVESHEVQTEDGYLLTMHRIPYGKAPGAGPGPNKPAILLHHGLLLSSASFVVLGPEKSLAYLLADRGYDVWMGNARGNTWSRKHIKWDPDNPLTRGQFWNFSWHEIGFYDLPALIDYIFLKTGQTKLHYVGHSQGATAVLVLLSLKPQYNDVMKSVHLLSAVSFMSHTQSPLLIALSPTANVVDLATTVVGNFEFAPSDLFWQLGGKLACMDASPIQELCAQTIFLIAGYDSEQFNRTILPTIFANTPAGASSKQLIHYAQEVNSGRFCQYDHGLIENLMKYNSISPPEYPLDKITTKISVHHSDNDWIAAPEDVKILLSKLPNVEAFHVSLEKFTHVDFIWAIDVKELLYNLLIEQIVNAN